MAHAVATKILGRRLSDAPASVRRDCRHTMKDFSSHFRQLVELELPGESRILVPRGGQDMMILATWKLDRDAFRASRRSRMVRIVITEEALKDYSRSGDDLRLTSDHRFKLWLRRQLSGFDPHHDAPLGVEPPPVTWALSTFDLNGGA